MQLWPSKILPQPTTKRRKQKAQQEMVRHEPHERQSDCHRKPEICTFSLRTKENEEVDIGWNRLQSSDTLVMKWRLREEVSFAICYVARYMKMSYYGVQRSHHIPTNISTSSETKITEDQEEEKIQALIGFTPLLEPRGMIVWNSSNYIQEILNDTKNTKIFEIRNTQKSCNFLTVNTKNKR